MSYGGIKAGTPALFLVNDGQTISHSGIMLDLASAGIFPAFAEIRSMTEAHVFERLCEEAKRNLDYAALLHVLGVVPLVGEKGVDDLIPLFFQGGNRLFSGCDDFSIGLSGHRLRKHGFHGLYLQ